MEGLEYFGILLIILGVIGMAVMVRGSRSSHNSMTKQGKSQDARV